ncbi:MAG: tRNA (adenosine(37)-N6)-dimethylallyltransferase MiaA [Gemmatimonadaceae bacterium]|nr:tRNA (adenosine(37)-N6)-dimethylallyltransferase MiaA [Gemmatimonadaceae bacterium]
MADDRLRVITGPTAAGKSALALALAERFPITIVSADSRQVYRDFDIGTAKPTLEERARVPHAGIDVGALAERGAAAAGAAMAARAIEDARARGTTPVVVGGTGFYVRALTAPLFAEPPLDAERRRALQRELDRLPTEELRRWCRALDPARAHLGRTQLLRAIEVALLTGTPISRWHASARRTDTIEARYLVVDPGAPLRERIAQRVEAMFAAGWEAEVARLDATVPDAAPAWNATGYSAVRDLVRGRTSRAAATERIVIDTRQYAKRQRTWFRHQLRDQPVTWLDPTTPGALDRAVRWWLGE